ncbi:MAG TPA: Gfo/Idh/MocA family oxidoreductase [Methylomirabilota bacterium]|nr:Gfo/Idh/MocA family oxidoreductase [Methylomirabilota bacterium]
MKTVRLGLVGLGNIGRYHAGYLLDKKISRCELVAVSDAYAPSLEPYKNRPGLKCFASCEEMIRSGAIDALVIATPHYLHTTLGIDALENGLHVMVEKPISAHKADAERLIACARKHPRQVFAGMFQMRVEPRYLKIKKLLASPEFGRFVRINWVITDWFRTEAYYASGGWRATWKGEGGGVLLNQCLHQLDMLQWLVGMPKRVRGFCQLGRYHDIEVEDDVTCYMEWANGATGVFISSTGEAPGTNRLEICGTGGKLVVEDNKMRFTRNEADMIEFSRTSKSGFAKPETWNCEIPFEPANNPHGILIQNFVDAILDGAPLIAPGAEGMGSVELANVLLFSSLLGQIIDLPMDGKAWEKKLNELIASSRHEKKVVASTAEDFTKSFNR